MTVESHEVLQFSRFDESYTASPKPRFVLGKINKTIASVMLSVASVMTGLADSITWTGAVDSDLAKPGNWGVDALGSCDDATIEMDGQTFSLGENTEFGTLTLAQAAATATFDFSVNPTKTLTFNSTSATGYGKLFGFLPKVEGSTLLFKGGIWQGGADSKASFNAVNDARTSKRGSAVFAGTTVTNFAYFYFGNRSYDQTVCLKSKSVVHVGDVVNYATGARNALDIEGGSRLVATGNLYSDFSGTPSGKTGCNRIVVRDPDTAVIAKALMLGYAHNGNELVVSNLASFTATSLTMGSEGNRFLSTNATVNFTGELTIAGTSNRFEIVDSDLTLTSGISMTGKNGVVLEHGCTGAMSGDLKVGGTSNLLELAGSFVGGVLAFSAAGSDNVYRFMRTCNVTASLSNPIGGNAEINLYGEGSTGGVFTCSDKILIGNNHEGVCLRLNDGLRFETEKSFYVGIQDRNGDGVNNAVYVGTNVVMKLPRIRMGNFGNRIVVDSGRVELRELSLCWANNRTDYAPSNTVLFSGAHPKVNWTVSNEDAWTVPTTNGWFEYDVPADGYESEPFVYNRGLVIDDNSQIIVHADVESISKAHNGECVYVPLMSGSSITVSDAKLSAMTAQLGQRGGRFVVREKTLCLRVASTKGLMILLK